MTAGNTALTIICAIAGLGACLGFLAARRRQLDLEEWAVAGRGLGLILVWILMAGECFTTFSVLGTSGWIYSRGGPVLYVLAYLALGQVFVFFFGPTIWELGRRYGLQTVADFFSKRYGNTLLTSVVALAGVFSLLVYLQLQLTGLGIIVGVASFEAVGRTPATVVSAIVVASFVLVSGVRGVVWVSVLKDALLVGIAVFAGISLPHIHFGGIGAMFAAVDKAKPGFLAMPGGTTNLTHSWFVTTVLINAIGFLCWPHFFGGIFTAKNADTVRKNSVIMPLYVLPLALIIIAGCTAVLVIPGLANGDLAFLTLIRKTYPPWVLGIIGGAGALTAMVPAAVQVLSAATLLAKNVYRPLISPSMPDEAIARVARIAVVVLMAVSLLFPGIFLGIVWKRASTSGIVTGLVGGLAVAEGLSLGNRDPFHGLNAGFIGLAVNTALVIGVGLLTKGGPNGFEPEPATGSPG
jgi:SSS family solute:Na+ symporter